MAASSSIQSKKTVQRKIVTLEQKNIFADLLTEEPTRSILFDQFGNDNTGQMKDDMWAHITEIMNAVPGGVKKSIDQWNKCFQNIKTRAKKKAADSHKALTKTGGGPNDAPKMLAYEEKIATKLIAKEQIVGLPVKESYLPTIATPSDKLTEVNNVISDDDDIVEDIPTALFDQNMPSTSRNIAANIPSTSQDLPTKKVLEKNLEQEVMAKHRKFLTGQTKKRKRVTTRQPLPTSFDRYFDALDRADKRDEERKRKKDMREDEVAQLKKRKLLLEIKELEKKQ